MNILFIQEKAKQIGIRGEFKALYEFCLNSLDSLDENELKSLLSLGYGDDSINCPSFLYFSNFSHVLTITNNKDFEISVQNNHPCTFNIPLGINELDICISHEENPVVYFTGVLFFDKNDNNFPDWILDEEDFTSVLKSIFGDCLVLDALDSNFKEFINNYCAKSNDYDEFHFSFGVRSTWFD